MCGSDGVTYGNACLAQCAGVDVSKECKCEDQCEGNSKDSKFWTILSQNCL